jgi:imidazolonepropionase-like amidohydrolase
MALYTCALLLAAAPGGAAQDSAPPAPSAAVAFVGATVVPLDRERLLPGRTVLVSARRIIAIGPADSVAVPPGAAVIDAAGRYLLPGLADMHVHLDVAAGARPGFGDGPLYLANGVTAVLNLRGDSATLVLRARLQEESLVGPTLYTAGDFVNEPRVNTPDEVEREVRARPPPGST